VGELDRIVIALMQELEISDLPGFVIATSNLPDQLGPRSLAAFLTWRSQFPGPSSSHEINRFSYAKANAFGLKITPSLLQSASAA